MTQDTAPDNPPPADAGPKIPKALKRGNVETIGWGVRVQWLGQIFFQAVRFCNAVLITNIIGAGNFGNFFYGITMIRFLSIFSMFGIDRGLTRFVARFETLKDRGRVLGAIRGGSGVVFLVSLVCAALIIVTCQNLPDWVRFGKIQITVMIVLAICLPMDSLAETFLGALRGMKLVQYSVYIRQVIMPVVRLIVTAGLLWLGFSLNGVLAAYLVTSAVAVVCAFYFLKKHVNFLRPKEKPTPFTKPLVKYSAPLAGASMLNLIDNPIGTIFLFQFCTNVEVGIMGAVKRFTSLLGLPAMSFTSIFSPIISELQTLNKTERLSELYAMVTRSILAITLAAALPAILFVDQITSIFGSDFTAGHYFAILSIASFIIDASAGSAGVMLAMTGHSRAILFNSVIVGIINVVAAYFFISKYGLLGAGITRVISIVVLTVLRVGAVFWFHRMHHFSLNYFKVLLSGAMAMGAAYEAIKLLTPDSPWLSVVLGTPVFFAVYVGALLLLGISKEEIKLYKSLIGRKSGQRPDSSGRETSRKSP